MDDLTRLIHRIRDADDKIEEAIFRIQALEEAIVHADSRGLPTANARKTLKHLHTAFEAMKLFRKSLETIYAVHILFQNRNREDD